MTDCYTEAVLESMMREGIIPLARELYPNQDDGICRQGDDFQAIYGRN